MNLERIKRAAQLTGVPPAGTRSNRTPAAELRDYASPLYGRHYKTDLNTGTMSEGRSHELTFSPWIRKESESYVTETN
jgi:hypothetical protein